MVAHSSNYSGAPPVTPDIKPFTQDRELGQVDPGRAQDAREQIASGPAAAGANIKERRPWAHFVAGGLGGMTAATLTSPLDVLKTRLQSTFYQDQLARSRAAKGIPAPNQLPFVRAAWLHISETGVGPKPDRSRPRTCDQLLGLRQWQEVYLEQLLQRSRDCSGAFIRCGFCGDHHWHCNEPYLACEDQIAARQADCRLSEQKAFGVSIVASLHPT
ncbi:hypothetical protein KC333_g187 [Hortaea werneckii]|nr:hypothetical protein KC333_g187 [Hortaea werneckii]